MDADKLSKLEEKLYNETPFLGDGIRQKAAKELAKDRSPESIQILAKALVFSKDKNIKNLVLSNLRNIKLQEKSLVDSVCQIWAENRSPDLGNLLKLKGWVAESPINLRLLTALNLAWKGVIEEKGIEVVKPLFTLLKDQDAQIQAQVKEWLTSLTEANLQQEVCRLASEENNQDALTIATEAGYAPTEPSQAVLFQYFTRQWSEIAKTDPDYKLLEETYYTAPDDLKKRIDEHGKNQRRAEWAWMILGGQEIRRAKEITFQQWDDIIETLTYGKQWEALWKLSSSAPAICTKTIVKKLKQNRWLPKHPRAKEKLADLIKLTTYMKNKSIPQGKLVRCFHTWEGHTQPIEAMAISTDGKIL